LITVALLVGVGVGDGTVPGVGLGVALGDGTELADVEEEPFPPQDASIRARVSIKEQV